MKAAMLTALAFACVFNSATAGDFGDPWGCFGSARYEAMARGLSCGESFSGVASFYGIESGSKTTSGERFNQNALTAAHRSLPMGTRLRVTYRGRSVIVRINDRGPFIRGRMLDLSTAAARAIGLTAAGTGHVTVEILR